MRLERADDDLTTIPVSAVELAAFSDNPPARTPYVVAQIAIDAFPTMFILGGVVPEGLNENVRYTNGPLKEGTYYTAFVRAFSPTLTATVSMRVEGAPLSHASSVTPSLSLSLPPFRCHARDRPCQDRTEYFRIRTSCLLLQQIPCLLLQQAPVSTVIGCTEIHICSLIAYMYVTWQFQNLSVVLPLVHAKAVRAYRRPGFNCVVKQLCFWLFKVDCEVKECDLPIRLSPPPGSPPAIAFE